MFRNAIVRIPGETFAKGLTTSQDGPPDYAKAMGQHRLYREALTRCGLEVKVLDPDPAYPDSTFIEDTAVLVPGAAILTHPGAASRRGEVPPVREAVGAFFPSMYTIEAPGTVDGGDVCEAGEAYFIGLSARTNEAGAEQLGAILRARGFSAEAIDIRDIPGLLHLKSGMAYLGDGRIVATEELAGHRAFREFEVVKVPQGEEYAANCVRVNDSVLVAAGYPTMKRLLMSMGYQVEVLSMSEFRKMDGGLSCLSLRF